MTEKGERRLILALVLLTDAFLVWAALSLATLTRLHTLVYLEGLIHLHRDQIVCTGLLLAATSVAGAHNPSRFTDRFDSVYYAVGGLAIMGALLMGATTFLPRDLVAISRRELASGALLAVVFMIAWRSRLARIASRFGSLHRFFNVLGSEEVADRIISGIRSNKSLHADARYVALEDLKSAGDGKAGADAPTAYPTQDAIICLIGEDREALAPALEYCESHFRRTYLYASLHDMLLFRHTNLLAIGGIPLLEVYDRDAPSLYPYLKRLVDVCTAVAGLLLSIPVCIPTAVAIKLTSKGPVFYTQERMGRSGARFRLYKFRSMVADAEAWTGPVWASAGDARVTRVGRFIRKHRIDEVPQLLNVLKGDMSLIGPRPERPHFHDEFCRKWPLFDRRLAVRPGVTSLSHVLGSYHSEPEDRLRYDLLYINSMSLILDLRIMLATVRIVLGAKGAQ